MNCVSKELIDRLWSKANQSESAYRISACAFSKKGNVLGYSANARHRKEAGLTGKYTGKHAEADLIQRYGPSIDTIIIMRIGLAGDILPIEPCPKCAKLAKKYNIKIISVEP
jgi:hypothetical protein